MNSIYLVRVYYQHAQLENVDFERIRFPAQLELGWHLRSTDFPNSGGPRGVADMGDVMLTAEWGRGRRGEVAAHLEVDVEETSFVVGK